jgi:hypothetical protein
MLVPWQAFEPKLILGYGLDITLEQITDRNTTFHWIKFVFPTELLHPPSLM